jgi:hypothetical protein
MAPVNEKNDITVVYEELKPIPSFPFPWSSDDFFQAMPESVKGIPCMLEPLSFDDKADFDLIIIAYQPWFLSPSIPYHAFFKNDKVRKLINGKPVVTIIGCRNMWVMAQEQIKQYINESGGYYAGNIVLRDKAPNLLSLVSIIRWLIKGKKEKHLIFPEAGVSKKDIHEAARFGNIIYKSVINNNIGELKSRLIDAGAVDIQPQLIMLEKRGKAFFQIWADFALKKGGYGSKVRNFRLRLFKYYLLTVLYLVSPFATLLFFMISPFRQKSISQQITRYQQ